ncbi:PP2C family serine/threonine-protein phosphatase [Calothrix sp. 336/3]|uniref:PP2C family serine/threonine-protein phosphatase n=1 Tax=Calothrix sp. 336/3 TaxID=1337936 RepID=UPI0004E3E45F|nr:PP2C family serine/threonine-protein phosphatase [Calothrix sp. 336/3]AKG23283.1 serine/threonine protein phosphatase [Calothrix sp. 336/3]
MNSLTQVSHWRIVAASICGTSHLKNEQLCQDAHHFLTLPNDILVVAAADGAGSASLGKVGAMVAVETAVESICRQGISRETFQDDGQVRSLLMEAIFNARSAVAQEAVACGTQAQELASTLIIAIATPEAVAVGQIGDGVAVARNAQGNLIALTKPDNGEYMNETTFLVSPGALETTQINIWHQAIVNIGVLTDGLQMLAMNMATSAPHKPFFLPLFDFVAKVDDRTVAKEQLVKFLRSERITERTDDDLTLVLAAFGN